MASEVPNRLSGLRCRSARCPQRSLFGRARHSVRAASLHCDGESSLNRFDSEIIKLSARRPENAHLAVSWCPNIRIGRAKEENAIGACGCREMRNSAVVSNECRARKDRSKAWQRQVPGETNIAILPFAFQSVRLSFVCLA